MTHISLEQWDAHIGHHLRMIESGAEQCEQHAKALLGVPNWETKAEEKMEIAEQLLATAYINLIRARQQMETKERVD